MKQSVRLVARINTCSNADCRTCSCIQEVRDMPKCVAAITSKQYTDTKHLPVAVALGDNSAAWQKFAVESLGLTANVCQTHATAIAANNGTHHTHFDNPDNYEEFYECVCRIMRCSFATVGERLQGLLAGALPLGRVRWGMKVRQGHVIGLLCRRNTSHPRYIMSSFSFLKQPDTIDCRTSFMRK